MIAALHERPVCHLFGVPINALTMDEALAVVDDVIGRRDRLLVGVVNAAKMVNMCRDCRLRCSVLSADMILADGMAVVWGCRVLRRRLPERVTGIDFMEHMLKRGNHRRYRVYCLGATEDVLQTTLRRIRNEYPDLILAGWHHGYFSADDEPRIAAGIRDARPDILFVAMTSPRKEQFLARWSTEINVPICHGVGGAFDVMAGKVRRAPAIWQRLGAEWLFRVLQEPGRMWRRYLVTNSLFAWFLLCELIGQLRSFRT